MTAHEAFDAWWESPTRPASLSRESDLLAKETWLAACAWQRARDAKVAEKYERAEQQREYKLIPREIAAAIRDQEVG